MGEILPLLFAISAIYLVSLAWKAFNWVWLKPKKLEKYLRQQGLRGPSYKFLFGDILEMVSATKEATSRPMEFSHQIVPRVLPFLHHSIQKYGKMSFTWTGPYPIVNIMDPDMIRDILSGKYEHCEKDGLQPLFKPLVTGIVTYNGEKWAKHRRIINPAFHVEKLKMMLPAFQTCCCEMIEKWQKLSPEELSELNVWDHLQDLTADVISRTAFSSSFEEGRKIFQLQKELAKLIMQAAKFMFIPGFRFRPTKGNRRIKEIEREMRLVLRNMIHDREKAMSAGEGCSNDLLGLLMESNLKETLDAGNSKNVGISIDEVIDECKLFYFAGQETTGNLLVWTMILLSIHKDWQEKAREEVLNVFGRRKPDFDGLNHLKIVSMILNEVLRLYPPAYTIGYRVSSKEMKVGEHTLPPGTLLGIRTLLVHHDRDLWGEDADEFNPTRFSEGLTKATNNKVSFIPFGWGTRVCIGQTFALNEAKMAISMILQCFSFDVSPTYVHAPYTVLTLQPQHGAQLILHKLSL
ncbi:hypothetical protein AQUCO_03800186v1 [Aquilegia coerulea]|uniref:Cytochrome P450 n=1 Tax=Aquilegia coerulea TaxID=218851 RepID=A0A2G5CSZ2_AQUCA|nr:hypothetical protein AQUCO_03800186v1 [Aquilegia coerulea]